MCSVNHSPQGFEMFAREKFVCSAREKFVCSVYHTRQVLENMVVNTYQILVFFCFAMYCKNCFKMHTQ